MVKKYDELNNYKKIKKEINFINDFEKIYNVKNTKEKLFNMGCESACLTGSGSYVVGILNKKTTNCYQNYNLKSK
jgi:4-diphosphocytidyl-2C-methyl-D-erythritol kinase